MGIAGGLDSGKLWPGSIRYSYRLNGNAPEIVGNKRRAPYADGEEGCCIDENL